MSANSSTTTITSSPGTSSCLSNSSFFTPPRLSHKFETPNRRFWGQEVNQDSLYHTYLKKITYSSNSDLIDSTTPIKTNSNSSSNSLVKVNGHMKTDSFKRRSDRKMKKDETLIGDRITRLDQSAERRRRSKSVDKSEIQCLQWETRQVRILKAATMDHIIEYILLLTPHQKEAKLSSSSSSSNHSHCNPLMEEERNDVSHIMHVLFCTYRIYCQPQELFQIFVKHSARATPQQVRFVLHYWLTNYPEDFLTTVKCQPCDDEESASSGVDETDKQQEALSIEPSVKNNNVKVNLPREQLNQRLLDLLLELPCLDETLYRKAHLVVKQCKSHSSDVNQSNGNIPLSKAPPNCVIELDPKFVAQQLTAIDLENFLSLKAYSLLNGHRHNQRVQSMIRNFNLLSKHVIVTILKSHSPELYTTHWINIAQQLRKMKNFNSLKAVIAGLNNESVFRLKSTVWSKISKGTEAIFKHLSTIVDDVDNQTLLRQTQLEIEGTAKVSIEEESFGTIPYLGTFLTDLTVIDTKLSNYIENPTEEGKRLINLEKCCEQFEIITQIHLLQKNINAALTAFHQSQQLTGLSQLPTYNSTPTVPRVARLFRTWFQDSTISDMTENDCYKLSLALETSQSQKK